MRINDSVINEVNAANAKLLVVTKYWNTSETGQIIAQLERQACVCGWGENRVQSLVEKELQRERTHFIGRLQSRQFEKIITYCSTIHSLASLAHAEKLNKKIIQKKLPPLKIFVQVNVAEDPAKSGTRPSELKTFLEDISGLKQLEVVGLSSMGWGEFEETEKRKEFQSLVNLRNEYLPGGLTSAGTSRDYVLALEEGIDVVRVGKGLLFK